MLVNGMQVFLNLCKKQAMESLDIFPQLVDGDTAFFVVYTIASGLCVIF